MFGIQIFKPKNAPESEFDAIFEFYVKRSPVSPNYRFELTFAILNQRNQNKAPICGFSRIRVQTVSIGVFYSDYNFWLTHAILKKLFLFECK